MNLREAIQLIYQNNSILLLGAGFSVPARNAANQNLPTGGQLAALLAGDLGIENKYPLQVVASRYLDSKGEHALNKKLAEIFTASTYTVDQERVALLPWRRAYTLNYDNVVELIYGQRGKDLAEVSFEDHVRTTDGPLQYIHLHGELYSASGPASDLILNVESYNKISANSGWFARFRSDVELADCVIAVGCSMSDLHLSSLFYNDPVIQGKTFFIDHEDMDDVWKGTLGKFGYVEPIGLRSFADQISATTVPALRRRSTPVCFDVFSPAVEARSATGSDVFDLVLLGNIKDEVLLDTSAKSDPTYNIWREDAASIINDIDSGDSLRRYIVHSDLGNGKSVISASLKSALYSRGYNVLTLKLVRDIISIDIPYLSELTPKTAIFVDDIFRTNNRSDLTALTSQFSQFIFVGTCRTSVFDLQGHEVPLLMSRGAHDYDANTLSDRECSQISDWFDQNGLWGDEAGRPQNQKMQILTQKCGREFRSIILDRFKSQFMRAKIDAVFRVIPEGLVKDWLLYVLIMEICGVDGNARFVQSISGLRPGRRDFENAGPIKEFVGTDGGKIAIRSPVLSQLLVSEMYETKKKIQSLVNIAKACDQNTNGRDVYSDLLKLTYRPAVMTALFPSPDYLSAAKSLFDELKKLDYLQSKSLFWLQYAIVLTNEHEYFSAKVIFDTAFGKARNSDFDTFQVDNHYARFLIESRMHAPAEFPDAFAAFIEAHTKIRAQILRDRSANHPFRVAELYPDFIRMRWASFDKRQRTVVERIGREMVEFLGRAKGRYRAQKIDATRTALEAFFDEGAGA